MSTARLLDDSNSEVLIDPISLGDGSVLELRTGTIPHQLPQVYKNGVILHEIVISGAPTTVLSVRNTRSDLEFLLTSLHAFLGELFKNLTAEEAMTAMVDYRAELERRMPYHSGSRIDSARGVLYNHGPLVCAGLFFFSFNQTSSAANINKVTLHCKLMESTVVDNHELAEKFMDIENMRGGLEAYDFLKLFPHVTVVDLSNKSAREFFHRAYSAFHAKSSGQVTMKLRDAPLIPFDKLDNKNAITKVITQLPIGTKRYRDYLLDKTLDDYRHLSGRILLGTPGATAILISERIIADGATIGERETKGAAVAEELVKNLESTVNHNRKNSSTFVLSRRVIREHSHQVECVSLLHEIFQESESSSFDLWEVVRNFLHSVFIQNWVVTAGDAGFVVGYLRDHMSALEVKKATDSVNELGKPFSVTQWIYFAENYETMFKDTPSSWWVSFM